MLSNYYIEKLIGLQGVIVENIQETIDKVDIYIKLKRKSHNCPHCGAKTKQIHDYRTQIVKDIESFGRKACIILKKRRYRCKCGKRFAEKNTFLPRYRRMTSRLAAFVIDKLREERSYSSVAREVNLSTSTVIRLFDMINYPEPTLLTVLSIDEFKGNAGGAKYQCIITDPVTGVVLDILPQRYDHYLTEYFKHMDRSQVNFFVSDMWRVYTNFASAYFKDATQIIDKYHWIRQGIWAFEAIRKQEQKKFSKTHRKYFKRSKSLLIKRFSYLCDEQKQRVNIMLYASPTLSTSYYLKESFLELLDCKDKDTAKEHLSKWVMDAQNSGIESFIKCAKTIIDWSTGILNSFDYPFTNGFTEGCNNKIKVLKRNAYGYRNFKRFRNRILHIFSHQRSKLQVAA